MSDPQLDALKTIDAQITSTLDEYRALHERTLNTLQMRAENLRGDELWPTDVAGPVFLVQRTYNERRSQLDEQWTRLLGQRRDLILGDATEKWADQLALTERLMNIALPELLDFEPPRLRRDQQVSTEKTREFYATVMTNLQTIAQTFDDIGRVWPTTGKSQQSAVQKPTQSDFGQAEVIVHLANIRREPFTVSPVLARVEQGTRWAVTSVSDRGSDGFRWYRIDFNGQTAWIREDIVQIVQSTQGEMHQEPARGRHASMSSAVPSPASPSEPMKPAKPDPVDPTPSIHQRQEEATTPTQQLSAAPPPPQQEPMPTPLDLDELDDDEFFGGMPEEASPPPPPPVITPSAPPSADYAPPPMRAPGVSTAPDKKTTDGRLAQANIEPTHFTAYAPKEVPPAQWVNLAAYIFRASASGAVEHDAQQKFGAQLAEMRHGKAAAVREIEEGATITATPRLDGFTFNPESLSLKFVKPYHRFDFEMMAGQERLNLASNGAITFSMGGVIVGEIPLSVFVGERATIEVGVVQADPYQKIFCSYSHRDTKVVERVERAYRVLGFDYLRDATRLRSGQQWNAELMRWIDEAHIFQLFWSAAAAQSPYVEQEWRHALHITRPNFIRPVYWKKPLIAPPSELEKLHFAYDPQIQGAGWWNRLAGLVRG
ncbi:MAG: hypothetical protein BroJett018_26350 [Chloroflexota bacterium]|nr:MAG: hypothetical protein BroJett018_26350 [Chloroflexota bacterium]